MYHWKTWHVLHQQRFRCSPPLHWRPFTCLRCSVFWCHSKEWVRCKFACVTTCVQADLGNAYLLLSGYIVQEPYTYHYKWVPYEVYICYFHICDLRSACGLPIFSQWTQFATFWTKPFGTLNALKMGVTLTFDSTDVLMTSALAIWGNKTPSVFQRNLSEFWMGVTGSGAS